MVNMEDKKKRHLQTDMLRTIYSSRRTRKEMSKRAEQLLTDSQVAG